MYVYRHACIYVWMYVWVYVCMYVRMYVCILCMYACMYACVYACMHTCLFADACPIANPYIHQNQQIDRHALCTQENIVAWGVCKLCWTVRVVIYVSGGYHFTTSNMPIQPSHDWWQHSCIRAGPNYSNHVLSLPTFQPLPQTLLNARDSVGKSRPPLVVMISGGPYAQRKVGQLISRGIGGHVGPQGDGKWQLVNSSHGSASLSESPENQRSCACLMSLKLSHSHSLYSECFGERSAHFCP